MVWDLQNFSGGALEETAGVGSRNPKKENAIQMNGVCLIEGFAIASEASRVEPAGIEPASQDNVCTGLYMLIR
jgi:hypothetical protein